MKRRLTYQLMTLVALFSVTMVLTTCKKGEEPENRDFDPTTSMESIVNINTSEIGGSGLKLISSRDDDSPISKESFNTVVSKEGEQLLVVADANDELRALTLSTPSTSKSDIIQLGARSTAITLVFISPGILSIDEQEATTVINNIVNLTSFNPFKTYLKSNLILKSLNDLVGTTLFDSLLIDCVEEYYQKFKVVTKGIDKGGYENMFSLNLGSNNKLELKNYSFRYVNVVKRDLNTASAELNVANVLPQMKGAVPLSWGSLFTLSTADPSIESIDYTPFANSSISEFWVAGPGFKKLQDNPPQSIKNIEQPYVETIVYYVIFPVLDLWTGAKNLLQTSTPKFKELMLQIKTVRSLYFTSTANNFISFARETSNFTITVLGAIAATSTAPIAAVAVKVLVISSVIFSSVNLVTFAIDMSQIEPYSKFNIIPPVSLPTVTTNSISNITQTSASSGGNVTSDGGATVTASGVCWSTTTGPTTALTTKTTDGSVTGSFTSSITGLTANTTYYVKAYATNSVGTAYGTQVSFTTSAAATVAPTLTTAATTSITQTTATSGGNITSNGGATVTASGVCWSTNTNPTISLSTKTMDGSATGAFTSSITGLTANTTYYVQAYATNSIGTAYGTQVSFTTSAASPVIPTLTTIAATSITQTTATSGGNITSNGGATVTASGVCWSTTTNPTISLTTKTTDGSATGAFTSSITGLTANITYYVKAYATNSVGTAYGDELTFTTSAVTSTVPGAPTIGTATAENGQATVTFTAPVSDGGSAITGYMITSSPGGLTATGTASPITVTGLTNGTTYTFTVTATNAIGSSVASSASNSVTPSATLTTVSDIDGNVYNTVTIGTQVWMAENLKITKYNDGTPIPNVTDNTAWAALTTGAYSDYSNTPANSTYYGRLYNWYAVDNNAATKVASNGGKNVCPTSWHVPTDAEWTTLTTYLGGESVAGGKLKETGTAHWISPNTGATNETGFTALPGGSHDGDGTFDGIGSYGIWWSSTEASTPGAYGRNMAYGSSNVYRDYGGSKQNGFSVRCLRDF